MSEKHRTYTEQGFKALQDELNYLKNVKREEIKADISQARSYGDLSENSEYDEAKNEQAKVETRIAELEQMINYAIVLDEKDIDTSVISVGSKVKVHNHKTGKTVEYSLVGSYEADPLSGKISDQSPIGKALIGVKAGTTVTAETPAGEIEIDVLEVTRPEA